ncbi:MAG: hypothetical protein ACLQDY_02580 [Streptosporangiaceae bacterium]
MDLRKTHGTGQATGSNDTVVPASKQVIFLLLAALPRLIAVGWPAAGRPGWTCSPPDPATTPLRTSSGS